MSKKERQKERLRDIHQDTEGNLIYTGEIYTVTGDVNAFRCRFTAGQVIILAMVISSGCIDAAGANNSFYVILPYIGEAIAVFILAWNSVRTIYAADRIRRYTLDACRTRIPGACRMLAIFAAAGMILSIVYMARNGMGNQPMKAVMYPVLKLVTTVAAEIYKKYYNGLEWELK